LKAAAAVGFSDHDNHVIRDHATAGLAESKLSVIDHDVVAAESSGSQRHRPSPRRFPVCASTGTLSRDVGGTDGAVGVEFITAPGTS
jgi:hypothetical protein